MLFNRHNFSIASLCDKERDYLGLHVTKDHTEVTNGHYLIRVQTPFNGNGKEMVNNYPQLEGKEVKTEFPLNQSVIIPADIAKDIQTAIPKEKNIPILNHAVITKDSTDKETEFITTDLSSQRSFKARNIESKFPNTDVILEDVKKAKKILTIGFNSDYLMKVAKVFKDNGIKGIKLEFQDEEHPVKITGTNTETEQEVTAILMPMKI